MKKIIILPVLLIAAMFISSCEQVTNPVETKGKLFVTSEPQGAQIFVNDVNTNKVTPDTVEADAGIVNIKLSKEGYRDTTVQVSVSAGQTGVINVKLTAYPGGLNITSDPEGATIWLDGTSTGYITPHTFEGLTAGEHTVKLVLAHYVDTTFVVTVVPNAQTSITTVVLTPVYKTFGPVKLYETVGTTASQPSGLDLSSGNAYGISSSDKDKVDIYYSSDGFLVRSAAYHQNMTRNTYFKIGTGTNLSDGVDSPVKDNSWAESMSDRETHYVFLYDEDGNYSKLKIVNYGGGTPGEPAWIEVQWIYNTAENNTRF